MTTTSNNKIYISYGTSFFDPNLIQPDGFRSKPAHAFWASAIDDVNDWRSWCVRECFRTCRVDNCVLFTLKPDTKILQINSKEALNEFPQIKRANIMGVGFDWEKIAKKYDAVTYNTQSKVFINYWDCDSIAILNPDKVKIIEKEKVADLLTEYDKAHLDKDLMLPSFLKYQLDMMNFNEELSVEKLIKAYNKDNTITHLFLKNNKIDEVSINNCTPIPLKKYTRKFRHSEEKQILSDLQTAAERLQQASLSITPPTL